MTSDGDVGRRPNPDLATLGRLVGRWTVSGDATGKVSYEWINDGHFVLQHFTLLFAEHAVSGIEVIGHLHTLGRRRASTSIRVPTTTREHFRLRLRTGRRHPHDLGWRTRRAVPLPRNLRQQRRAHRIMGLRRRRWLHHDHAPGAKLIDAHRSPDAAAGEASVIAGLHNVSRRSAMRRPADDIVGFAGGENVEGWTGRLQKPHSTTLVARTGHPPSRVDPPARILRSRQLAARRTLPAARPGHAGHRRFARPRPSDLRRAIGRSPGLRQLGRLRAPT